MKKFLCYDTNDAASGKINVDNRGMLKPNSTVPSTNGTPYQQLVTDGEGNAKWEDRLAYETEPVFTEFVPEETVSFTPNSGNMSALWPPTFNAVEGSTYAVKFDGTEHKCSCVRFGGEDGPLVLGNLSILGAGDDTGEPFIMVYDEGWAILSSDSATEHTISISGIYQETIKIPKKFLPDTFRIYYGFPGEWTIDVKENLYEEFKSGKLILISYNHVIGLVLSAIYAETLGLNLSYLTYDGQLCTFAGNTLSTSDISSNGISSLISKKINEIRQITLYSVAPSSVSSGEIFSASLKWNPHTNKPSLYTQGKTYTSGVIDMVYSDLFKNGDDSMILKSSTSGSSKKFKITVDDSGTISATEVTS